MTRTRLLAATAVATLTTLVAGCGGSSGDDTASKGSDSSASSSPEAAADVTEGKSAAQVLEVAKKAVGEEKYVNLDGKGDADGQSIELHMAYAGEDAGGTVSLGQGELTLLKHGSSSWFKADDAFWKAQAGAQADQITQVVGDRWIVGSETGQLASLSQLASTSFITEQVLDPSGTLKKGDDAEVDGTPCVVLTSGDGELCVSKEDGRPLRITSGKNKATLDFTYDQKDIEPAPAAKDTIDLAKLAG